MSRAGEGSRSGRPTAHEALLRLLNWFCLVIAAGCSPNNLLENPGFENGTAPWYHIERPYWRGFEITDAYALEGKYSARLALRHDEDLQGTLIYGLIQEVNPPAFPRELSGYYRVENWRRGTDKQYIQFVVIVFVDPRQYGVPNIQIRYILAGVAEPPVRISNARFVFLGDAAVRQSSWIRFERDLQADFSQQWGRIPDRFEKIRLLFEVRVDDRRPGEPAAAADVYFDELVLR